MDSNRYSEYIKNIKSGDLLVWTTSKRQPLMARILTQIVRVFTVSEYCHVGIAYQKEDGLHVIEANPKVIEVHKLTDQDAFYHMPMGLEWTVEQEQFMLSKVGLPYSYYDAISAYFGRCTESDETWQCAELANAFYKFSGIDLGNNKTPASLVEAASDILGQPLVRVLKR